MRLPLPIPRVPRVRPRALVLTLCLLAGPGLGSQAPAPVPSSTFDPTERSIEELQRAMAAGEVTSRQLVDLYLARTAAYDQQGPALNALVALNPRAREEAGRLDAERAAGRLRGPLHGIPVVVKDNYETIEMPTSAGSIALAGFHPARDAYQVRRLKEAGAVILAKTNMHELAAGITTVGSRFGQTRNPYDLDRNPGGSSGGTGAAVAASFAAAGMGSDTCGSIRNPASHNNLVGLRGTQGLSSRAGIVPLSSTQDIGGPLARTIADLAIMLDATVGPDPADASTAISEGRIPASYRAALGTGALTGVRLGVLRGLFGSAPEDQEVTAIVQRALDTLAKAGAEVTDVAIPGLDDLLRDSSMINADFKFDLAAYLAAAGTAPVGSLGEILDRGLYHSALEATFRARNGVEARESEQSRVARIKRRMLAAGVTAALEQHRLTAIVYPTLRRKPARIGDPQGGTNCQLSAHAGLPALGVPAGFSDDGVPVGMDLLGAAFDEPALLALGHGIERALGLRRAPFSTPPLVNGQAPAPRSTTAAHGSTRVRLTLDPTTAQVRYLVDAPAASAPMAIWLHTGRPAEPGAARHLLFAEGLSASGVVTLSAADRGALAEGRLFIRFYPRPPAAPGDVPLSFDAAPPATGAKPGPVAASGVATVR